MSEEQTNQSSVKPRSNFLTPMAIVMAGVLIAVGLVVKDNPQVLGAKFAKESQTNQNTVPTQPQKPAQPKPLKPFYLDVEEAQGPVLGQPNAPVTIIEISDYECPACKAHIIRGAATQIKEKYINTGKVRLVLRDFPLSIHDPAATKDAEVAECVRTVGGDTAYFKFHDLLFENSRGNGLGIEDIKLYQLATQVGIDSSQVKTCFENKKTSQVVQDDVNQIMGYAQTIDQELNDRVAKGDEDSRWIGNFGLGTPAFFIGKTSADGKMKGEFISGAQPFSSFEALIEKYLK